MKILIISPGLNMYGSERSITTALQSTSNVDPIFLTPKDANVTHMWQKLGFAVIESEFPTRSIYRAPAAHFKLLAHVYRTIVKIKPDVVVINLDGSSAIFSLAAKLARIPVLRFQRFEIDARLSIGAKITLVLSDTIVCPSEVVARQVKRLLPRRHQSKVVARYNPVSLPSTKGRNAAPPHLTYSHRGAVVFGYIGRICPGKGLETLIDAASILKRNGTRCRILIAGQPTEDEYGHNYLRGLESRRDTHDLHESIEFLGYFSDSRDFFEKIDVAILPSQSESFGRALAEAWANELASICSDIPALKEINDISGGGLLFRTGDPADLARAMSEALNDGALLKDLASSGRKWVEEACSERDYGRFFEELLVNLHHRSS